MLPDEDSSSASNFKVYFERLLTNYRYHLFIALGGLLILGVIITFIKGGVSNLNGEGKVEVIEASASGQVRGATAQEIIAEISGEVQKPGVYTLPSGSRIDDLLQKAEGITEDADIEWIAKALNKAAKLVDGQKLYIPARNASHNDSGGTKITASTLNYQTDNPNANNSIANTEESVSRTIIPQPQNGLTNINTASPKELDKLPGIGPVYAQKIIDQRPYSSIDELSSKKVIPSSTYQKIKDKISVY